MRISGPAAGHDRLKTAADPSGSKVFGMLNNCAGGRTPWGTWLSCEENINGYFTGELAAEPSRRRATTSAWAFPAAGTIGATTSIASTSPRSPTRPIASAGWWRSIRSIPASMPVKRTALGRFKHEGAAGILNKDGRYVIYSGDDQRFDYVYKFVTEGRFDPSNRAANMDLLDSGTFYVARFNADGTGDWLPLVHGQGAFDRGQRLQEPGRCVIEARIAADLLGATKMDRPEDIEANPKTNKVYVMLTNNSQRKADQVDAANPRADNRFGHIIEIIPDGEDHASTKFRWEILVKCGDPSIAAVGATFNPEHVQGWLVRHARQLRRRFDGPAVDLHRRQLSEAYRPLRWPMGDGDGGRGARNLQAVLSLSAWCRDVRTRVHAGRHDACSWPCSIPARPTKAIPTPNLRSSKSPVTRWPDFKDGIPPRPSIVVVTRKGGGKIGV